MRRLILIAAIFLIAFANLQGQWEILNEGVKSSLNAIDFANENIGWIAGNDGLLFKTKDGGQTWRSLPRLGNWHIRIIDFINDSVGWAVGAASDYSKEAIMK